MSILALSGCQTTKPAQIVIAPSLRETCLTDDPKPFQTVNELGDYTLKQRQALLLCEAKRQGLIQTIDQSAKLTIEGPPK